MSIGDLLQQCECPTAWWGTAPPPCPVHNPQYGAATIGATVPYETLRYSFTPNRTLSDADVERIAKRVVELMPKPAPRRRKDK